MRAQVAVALALVVAACGSSVQVKTVIGPDGTHWTTIRCKYQDDCLEAAGNACPSGYNRREETSQEESKSSGTAMWNKGGGSAFASSESGAVNVLVIKCKGKSTAQTKAESCGHDFDTHGCQGSSKWVEATGACEPCSTS